MKLLFNQLYVLGFIILIGCGAGNQQSATSNQQPATSNQQQETRIVGQWEQQYTCFDKNDNNKLEPGEKIASGTRLGFDWFRFDADGSCLRDKDIKFKGTYQVQEKNGTKKLLIQGGDNLRYTIIELTGEELVLGSDGAFIVFKRIN